MTSGEPAGRPPARRPHWGAPLARSALGAAALIGLVWVIAGVDLARVVATVRRAGWSLLLVPLPTLVAMAIDSRVWQTILRALGYRVRWYPLLRLRLSVESVVLALPGGAVAGEAMKLALLRRHLGVPFDTGAASLAVTKALLAGAAGIYLLIGAALLGTTQLLSRQSSSPVPALIAMGAGVITAAIAAALILLLRQPDWLGGVARRLGSVPSARLRRWLHAQTDRFQELGELTRRFFASPLPLQRRCLAGLVLEWLIEGVETLLILRCLSVPIGFGGALVLDGVGSLMRVIVFFVPAGLGFQDGAQVLILGMLGVQDAATAGVALIFIKRTKELLWIVTGASLWAATRGSMAAVGGCDTRQEPPPEAPTPLVPPAPGDGWREGSRP